jgi:predicted ATP-grasp superfamily ATP-dependent carboligase
VKQADRVQAGASAIRYDALVLDAKLRQSLVALRSLGSRGMRVAALECFDARDASESLPSFSSRWCERGYKAPEYIPRVEPFLTYLQQILQGQRVRVLITSSDGTLALVREHRQELEKHVRIALAKEDALVSACNKEQTLQIAQHLGLCVPRGVVVRDVQEVAAAICEVGLPAVVKPVETWSWGAGDRQGSRLICALVTTQVEAQRAVEKLARHGVAVLFQQYLSGRREAVSLLYAHNRFYARFAQWARRTQPPLGGTSVLRQSIALPWDITEQAEALVQAMDLEGYAEVEFRRDARGKAFLMEVNPRLSASVEVAVRAGVDFPYLLYQWANGDRIERVEKYRVGGWMRYLGGDIVATAQMIAQQGRPDVPSLPRAIYEFFAAFFLPGGYDYLDWRDPMPAWIATQTFASRMLYRIQTKISSRRV